MEQVFKDEILGGVLEIPGSAGREKSGTGLSSPNKIVGPVPAPSQAIPAPQLITANFLQVYN